MHWHFWLSVAGIFLMQFDLLVAGLVQGTMWASLAPFIDSVAASVPYWWVRMVSGMMIFVGESIFILNVFMTWRQSRIAAPSPAMAPVGAG
jgi:cbb3-type cytochrome oxidase subunit 1